PESGHDFCGNPLSRSLLGVKQTSLFATHMSAFDPKRTFFSPNVGPQFNSLQSPRVPIIRLHGSIPEHAARGVRFFCGLAFREMGPCPHSHAVILERLPARSLLAPLRCPQPTRRRVTQRPTSGRETLSRR